jgi:hypothetical protein
MISGHSPPTGPLLVPLKIPNRRKTSEHVTKMDISIRTMIIHVSPKFKPPECIQFDYDRSKGERGKHTGHFFVGDGVREHLGEVEEHAAALVEDLDSGFYFEVFCWGWLVRRGGFFLKRKFGAAWRWYL